MSLPSHPWSFHTHSEFCDGEGRPEDVVVAAIAASASDLGFSSHAPLPFETDWNMPVARLAEYRTEITRLQSRYAGKIKLHLGAELDLIPLSAVEKFQRLTIFTAGFDYFVGSVHFLGSGYPPASFDGTEEEFGRILKQEYGRDVRAMSGDYYERVAQMPSLLGVKIVGHFDLIKRWNAGTAYFEDDHSWYLDQVEGALNRIAGSGLAIELNTAGWRKGLGEPYPSIHILKRCRDLKIPVTISSDSHTPQQVVWGFNRAVHLLHSLDIRPVNPADLIPS